MRQGLIAKITIDFLMMISLLALMAYELIGAATHELVGTSMFTLVIAHNILNRKWWRNIVKGKYTHVRIIQTIINLLIFTGLIVQLISGIMMSRHVFTFLPIDEGMSYARTLHMIGGYWNLVLMSVHLGFHGSMLMGIAKKATHINEFSRLCVIVLRLAALAISAYGINAFVKRELGSYMLLKNQFVFFDFNEPLILFFIDYLAIVAMFACTGHYTLQGISYIYGKRKSIKNNSL